MVSIAAKSLKRKFGGKKFTNVASKPTKKEAQARADGWRKKGYQARVVPCGKGYDIYVYP